MTKTALVQAGDGLAQTYSPQGNKSNTNKQFTEKKSGMFLNGSFYKEDPINDPMKLNKASVLDLKSLKSYDNSIYPFFDKTDESVLVEFSIGAGYAYSQNGFSFSPYVKANYSKAEIDATAENKIANPSLAYNQALSDDQQFTESFSGVLGSQFEYSLNTNMGVITPYLRLEWEHEFDDNARQLSARFFRASNNPQDPESITNSSLSGEFDRDFFNVGIGISTVFPQGIIGFIDYETILGLEDLTNHQVSAGLQFKF
jgi:outer membrane autotransporter protein